MRQIPFLNILGFFLLCMASIFIGACQEQEVDEFAGLIDKNNPDPLAFLDKIDVQGNLTPAQSENINTITFSENYSSIHDWGKLKLSQEGTTIVPMEREGLYNVLLLARQGKKQTTYIPSDVEIGDLMDIQKTNIIDSKIYNIVDSFFDLMKKKELDKKMTSVVIASEIPIVSRQVKQSAKYGPQISEVRLGLIKVVDTNKRSALVRIIINKDDFQARTKARFYFQNVNGEWLISAIEGDFNQLNQQYVSNRIFSPQGTTGVTQGF